MELRLTGAALVALAVCTGSVPASAQMRDNTTKQLSCDNSNNNGDRARHCEIREQTLPSIGRLAVDAGPNGGVTVKGWLRGDVLVRSRIDAQGDTQAAAASLASRVTIDGSGGQVHATGPESANDSWWSVSYEVFVPQSTDLTLKSNNGGMNISDVRGQIHFDVNNGGVNLKRVGGDVSGATVNGGIQVELTGAIWDGRQMDVKTHNGGVNVSMPANYSAHVQMETGSGRIQSDFANNLQAENRSHRMDFNVGSGGPLLHVSTVNGGVHLSRAQQ